jgi:hypothetical protein
MQEYIRMRARARVCVCVGGGEILTSFWYILCLTFFKTMINMKFLPCSKHTHLSYKDQQANVV